MKTFLIFDITSTILNSRQSVRALINQLIYNTNNKCLILHHKAFRADYILRSTKIGAPSAAQILVLREF